MTLSHILHELFDKLALWFEGTVGRVPIFTPPHSQTDHHQDIPNSYKACSTVPPFHAVAHVPEYVQFRTNGRTFLYHHQDIWRYMRLVTVLHIRLVQQNITVIWTTTIHL